MAAMIQNDQDKAWMQPIMDYRDRFLAVEDRDLRDFRRMNGRIILMNDRLVHGPYTQERRAELLRELLSTQKQIQKAVPDWGENGLELIQLEELQEIRRQWVVEKGEIEDLVPHIYEEVYGKPYPGVELDVMPLDVDDLSLLKEVSEAWIAEQIPCDDETLKQRSDELYKLTRTLLAASFRGLQSRNRSGQLDELESVLKNFAFIDESDALDFAKTHLKDDSNKVGELVPAYEVDSEEELDESTAKVIPINPIVT